MKSNSIPQVVEHIKAGLVADALQPIAYSVKIGDKVYDIIPQSQLGLTFLRIPQYPMLKQYSLEVHHFWVQFP